MSRSAGKGLAALPAPVAWVCTGMGARAAAQVGMAEVLLEQGLRPDLLVGSSTGAINAAALTQPPESLEEVRTVWRRIGSDSVLGSLGAAAVRAFAPRRTGRSARELREILVAVLPGGADEQLPDCLTLVASDLGTGEPVTLRTGATIDALMASACVPIVFAPVGHEGSLYVDGGLTASAPLDQALDAGAGSIVLLDTGASAVPDEVVADFRWWQIAAIAYTHQIRGQLGHALARVAEVVPVVTLSTDEGSQLDFTRPDDLFEAGRTVAADVLARSLGSGAPARPGVYGIPLGFEDDPRVTRLRR